MSVKYCKTCGTLYDATSTGECPKCATKPIMDQIAANALPAQESGLPEEELRRKRLVSWVEILIGVPMLIGFIYLIIYLLKLLQS